MLFGWWGFVVRLVGKQAAFLAHDDDDDNDSQDDQQRQNDHHGYDDSADFGCLIGKVEIDAIRFGIDEIVFVFKCCFRRQFRIIDFICRNIFVQFPIQILLIPLFVVDVEEAAAVFGFCGLCSCCKFSLIRSNVDWRDRRVGARCGDGGGQLLRSGLLKLVVVELNETLTA
ncbi:conserved hypothetical protein [Trichinella spiralis]|uniref:hypothetical protein n=1 Tax=Trichinella spiralis TaxID=6334 RepID=UPI0001EFECB7|nr:conserved hypothetical protein [Trichinella spiralis]